MKYQIKSTTSRAVILKDRARKDTTISQFLNILLNKIDYARK